MLLLHKIDAKKLFFPPVEDALEDGLLAFGGDLSTDRLLLAYKSGIFPWYSADEPILWWSPNPRFVLFPEKLKISDSMKSILKKKPFQITYNQAFESVILACANTLRKDQEGTWITDEIKNAYIKLHQMQIVQSIEVWQNATLVGGLYGLKMGNCFFGESMFSLVSNASKAGFITFIKDNPDLKIIDCQVYTNHLESLGAEMIQRNEFLRLIHLYM
ncbi:MAG: leucyl/phenylalanyl-tRNA--protein transferase [Bacteroidetes bacterium]|nr:MAG: leucyl/phenylalanyl-tRNA--protein transferase [Bacteroidota bacterium]